MFYVAAFGRAEDEYRFHESGNVISKTLYPSLVVQPSLNRYQYCLRARISSNLSSNLLELIPTNCSTTSAVICRQKIYKPPLCSTSSSGNNDILAKDPMKLMMDSMMLNQKEMLVKITKGNLIEMFSRLNKTASFDILFR